MLIGKLIQFTLTEHSSQVTYFSLGDFAIVFVDIFGNILGKSWSRCSEYYPFLSTFPQHPYFLLVVLTPVYSPLCVLLWTAIALNCFRSLNVGKLNFTKGRSSHPTLSTKMYFHSSYHMLLQTYQNLSKFWSSRSMCTKAPLKVYLWLPWTFLKPPHAFLKRVLVIVERCNG